MALDIDTFAKKDYNDYLRTVRMISDIIKYVDKDLWEDEYNIKVKDEATQRKAVMKLHGLVDFYLLHFGEKYNNGK